jgi:hypothetical protein
MAERVRNSEWKQDQLLQNDIKKYVLGPVYMARLARQPGKRDLAV